MPEKDYALQVRLSQGEKAAIATAARISGVSTSAWVRDRLRRAARTELQESGFMVPFLEQGGVVR